MKKSLIIPVIILFSISLPAESQVGKFLKNVKNAVQKDLLGTPDNNTSKPGPEPPSACSDAALVFELGKYKIDYSELRINVLDDGSILLLDNMNYKFYMVRDGITEGPFADNDPRIRRFDAISNNERDSYGLTYIYKDFITRQGEKYLITFKGKTYGPYSEISRFGVAGSGDKFAAAVIENIIVKEDEAKKMEAAIENAKTDQEKIELGIKYAQLMQQRMLEGGGPKSMMPKLVSNMPVADLSDDYSLATGMFYTNMKYDDIVIATESKITDLQGKTIFNLAMGTYDPENTFISSDNSRYATFSYGTLTFSDGKKLAELFNPHLIRLDGKIYLEYFYYSPKRNAIMKCKLPF